jgi:Protein of unknown function (DUF2442)
MHTHADAEEDRTPEIVPPISPQAPWRVAEVKAQPGFRLWVHFNDGTEGEVNMAALVHSPNAGVFAALRDEMLFRQVRLELGAVTWPGEFDLAPDAMYAAIRQTGKWVLI